MGFHFFLKQAEKLMLPFFSDDEFCYQKLEISSPELFSPIVFANCFCVFFNKNYLNEKLLKLFVERFWCFGVFDLPRLPPAPPTRPPRPKGFCQSWRICT